MTDDFTLIHGDCLEVMKGMEAGSVDAVITDLPYGTTACNWDNVIPFAPMWEAIKHVLKKGGVFVTTASQPFTSKLVCSNLDWFKYELIWEKERPSNIFLMHIQAGKTHENIVIFNDGCNSTYNPQSVKNGKKRTREQMQKYVGNSLKHTGKSITSYRSDWDGSVSMPRSVLYFVRDIDKDAHPTQKPVKLYEYLIRTYTNPNEVVLDMCAGSGTTGVACHLTGRKFIGIEIDKTYYDIACKRIAAARQQPLLFKPEEA